MVEAHEAIGVETQRGTEFHRGKAGQEKKALGSTRMLLQIHDELVFETAREEAPAAAREIVKIMEGAMTLTVPLKADVRWAENWFEGK